MSNINTAEKTVSNPINTIFISNSQFEKYIFGNNLIYAPTEYINANQLNSLIAIVPPVNVGIRDHRNVTTIKNLT